MKQSNLRSVDYRRDGAIYQRCSRCHWEQRTTNLVLPAHATQRTKTLGPVMIGQELIAFICSDCFWSTMNQIVASFPDEHPFPFVHEDGTLAPNPRCTCGTALHYASTNIDASMLCKSCDAEAFATFKLPMVAT